MSVFDGQIKTPRAVPDPFLDHTLPPSGALNYAAITTPTALTSPNGVVTSLVTGDHNEIFNGNEVRLITLDREHTILGNQVSKVLKDRHDEIDQNYNQHVTGATQRTHVGATAEHFVAEHTNSHQANRHMEEPESVFHVIQEKSETINQKYGNFWHKVEIVGNKEESCLGTAVGYTSASFELKLLSLGAFIYANDVSAIKTEEFATKADVEALQGRVTAVEGRAGATNINVLALFVTPFALGVYI